MALACAATVLKPAPLAAQLLGGGGPAPPRPAPLVDPLLPTGARAAPWLPRPPTDPAPACSFRHPICVHSGSKVAGSRTLEWLSALEEAYELLVVVLGQPEPLGDGTAGGSPALDLYLVEGTETLAVEADFPVGLGTDRAPAFCRVGADQLEARAAALCVAEASVHALDAAEAPHVRRAVAEHLWLVAGHPTSDDARAIDDVQRAPERAIVARERSSLSAGGALLFEYLDFKHSRHRPGFLSASLLALSAGRTPAGSWQWHNEPDVMDVLRSTFDPERSGLARVMGDFAVTRAFLGSRGTGEHLPTLAWSADFGRVRFDWVIPFSSLPRRVAPARPIEPTGAAYLWLELDEVPLAATLAFQAEWEAPVSFKWILVKVGADGRELGRVDVPYLERATSVDRTLVDFEDAAGVLIVGTNLGGVDLAHPFDPDFEPFEPQGYTVYLALL